MRARIVIALVIVVVFVVSGLVHAQSGGDYDLTWHTVDNGGVSFRMGNEYQISGTIGQPDTGTLSGGGYTLVGGFWQGETAAGDTYRVYLPLALRQVP